jgi:hypothetical protein
VPVHGCVHCRSRLRAPGCATPVTATRLHARHPARASARLPRFRLGTSQPGAAFSFTEPVPRNA